MIIDPIDQNIRDQGFNFVPFDKYLADPFKPYTLDMSGGITTLPKPMFPPIIRRDEGGDGTGGPTTTEEGEVAYTYIKNLKEQDNKDNLKKNYKIQILEIW